MHAEILHLGRVRLRRPRAPTAPTDATAQEKEVVSLLAARLPREESSRRARARRDETKPRARR